MRFDSRIKIFRHNLYVNFSEIQTLEGVTSLLPNGKHIVLADIEGCNLEQTEKELLFVQQKYGLSHIFITSDKDRSYRVWCYSQVDFKTLLKILLDIPHIDYNFFYWTVQRSKATLRVSDKKDRPPQKTVSVLWSYGVPFPESCEKVIYDTGVVKRGLTLVLDGDKAFLKRGLGNG